MMGENEGIIDGIQAPDYFLHHNQYKSNKESNLENEKSKTANIADLIHEFNKGQKSTKG